VVNSKKNKRGTKKIHWRQLNRKGGCDLLLLMLVVVANGKTAKRQNQTAITLFLFYKYHHERLLFTLHHVIPHPYIYIT